MDRGKIFDLADVDPWPSDYPGVDMKMADGKNMQLVWPTFQPSSSYNLHSIEREQFGFMLSGRMRLSVGDEVAEIGPGDMWHSPSNVVHRGGLEAALGANLLGAMVDGLRP